MLVDLRPAAIQALASSPAVARAVEDAGDRVAQQARRNVVQAYGGKQSVQRYSGAIRTESGTDDGAAFTDVGYAKSHAGFVLWWSEVGTELMSAAPHLRLAVEQARR